MFWSTTLAKKSFFDAHTHTSLPEKRCCAAATAIDKVIVSFRLLADTILSDESCRVYDTRGGKWSQDWPDLNIGRRKPHLCV